MNSGNFYQYCKGKIIRGLKVLRRLSLSTAQLFPRLYWFACHGLSLRPSALTAKLRGVWFLHKCDASRPKNKTSIRPDLFANPLLTIRRISIIDCPSWRKSPLSQAVQAYHWRGLLSEDGLGLDAGTSTKPVTHWLSHRSSKKMLPRSPNTTDNFVPQSSCEIVQLNVKPFQSLGSAQIKI